MAKYSNITFEKVMKSVQYLEHRSEKVLRVIKFGKRRKTILGIQAPLHSKINFQDYSSIANLNKVDLNLYKSFKKVSAYKEKRELEIFSLIENGYHVIDSSVIFNTINLSRQRQMN